MLSTLCHCEGAIFWRATEAIQFRLLRPSLGLKAERGARNDSKKTAKIVNNARNSYILI